MFSARWNKVLDILNHFLKTEMQTGLTRTKFEWEGKLFLTITYHLEIKDTDLKHVRRL